MTISSNTLARAGDYDQLVCMNPDLEPQLAAYETMLSMMNDEQVIEESERVERNSPKCDLVAGELEKRGLA